jgi:hypothetical protein
MKHAVDTSEFVGGGGSGRFGLLGRRDVQRSSIAVTPAPVISRAIAARPWVLTSVRTKFAPDVTSKRAAA